MISQFKLSGLGRRKSVTCQVIGGTEEIFWPKVEMTQERFDALWDFYANRGEGEQFIANIKHEGLYEDGTPRKPVLIDIEYKQP